MSNRATHLLSVTLAASLLAGCANGLAQQSRVPESARPAYVDLARLILAHPFAPALAQDDRMIRALRSAQTAPGLTATSSSIENGRAALDAEFGDVTVRLRSLVDQKAALYAAREDAAIASLVGQDRSNASTAVNLERIRQNYQREYADLQVAAQRGMQQYRNVLLSQVTAQLTHYAQALRAEANASYGALAGNLANEAAARDLRFARDHADKRLLLQLRLDTLVLDEHEQARIEAQLNALNAQRAKLNAMQQQQEARVLAEARERLRKAAFASYADASTEIHAAAKNNLGTRTRVLQEQTTPLAALPSMPNLHSAVTMLSNYYQGRFRADVTSMTDAFVAVRSDLDGRFTALHGADTNANAATRAEIARLVDDRRRLHDEIVAEIMTSAQQVAKTKGLSTVYRSAREAPQHSVDITAAVNDSFKRLRI